MDDGRYGFYGFAQPPFLPVTEPAKIFHAGSRTGVVEEILADVLDGNEIVMVRGARGSGKTSLLPVLTAALSARDVLVVQVSGALQTPQDVERLMRRAGGPAADMLEPGQLGRRLESDRPEQVALLFDDADTLPDSMFGFLQRLLKLAGLTGTSLSLVLVGGPGVWAGLMHPDLEEMGLAGMSAHRLTGLSPAEAAAYLDHRLSSAGQPIGRIMTPTAVTELVEHSSRVPGQLNELAERALDLGYRRGTRRITAKMLRRAVSGAPPPRERAVLPRLSLIAACVALVAIAVSAVTIRLRPGALSDRVVTVRQLPHPVTTARQPDRKPGPTPQPTGQTLQMAQVPATAPSLPAQLSSPIPTPAAREPGPNQNPSPTASAKPPAPLAQPEAVPAPAPKAPAGAAGGAPGLVLIAGPGDDMPTLYARVYKGLTKPPYDAVIAVNKMPVKPGAIVVFPEPPDGWSPPHASTKPGY